MAPVLQLSFKIPCLFEPDTCDLPFNAGLGNNAHEGGAIALPVTFYSCIRSVAIRVAEIMPGMLVRLIEMD